MSKCDYKSIKLCEPRVSVIIPIYNGEKYICEAIDSVLDQTFKDCEIIVIDDGSTDGTRRMLQPYIEKGVIRYFHQENKDVSAARNAGVRYARGEFIAFLDQDDIWLPNKLALSIKHLDAFPEQAMVYSDAFLTDSQGIVTKRWLEEKRYFNEGLIYENLLSESFILPSCNVIKKSVFLDAGGFDEKISYTEDIDLWLRITKRNKVGLINKPLVKWRQHEANKSKEYILCLKNIIKVYEKQIKNGQDISQELYSIIIAKLQMRYFILGWHYQNKNLFKEAKDAFLESLRLGFTFKAFFYFCCCLLPTGLLTFLKKLKGNLNIKALLNS